MKGKSLKISKLILALCELVIGVLLLINPIGFTKAVIVIFGVLLLLAGTASILGYFRQLPEEAAREQGLSSGILEVAAGLFCIFKSGWFMDTFPLLTVLYGIIILITGAGKVQWTVDLLRMKSEKWFWAAINAAVAVIGAVIILCNPFDSVKVLWTVIAVSLIAEAVLDVVVLEMEAGHLKYVK